MEELDANTCATLFPIGPPGAHAFDSPSDEAAGQLAGVVEKLARRDIECFAIDLTRKAIGVPATRVVAPLLQPLPATTVTARLERTVARFGGQNSETFGIDLI